MKTIGKTIFLLAFIGLIVGCKKDDLSNEEAQIVKKWTLYKWKNDFVGEQMVTNGTYLELKKDKSYKNTIPTLGATSGSWMVSSNKLSLSSDGTNTAYAIISAAPELVIMDSDNNGVNDSTMFYFN